MQIYPLDPLAVTHQGLTVYHSFTVIITVVHVRHGHGADDQGRPQPCGQPPAGRLTTVVTTTTVVRQRRRQPGTSSSTAQSRRLRAPGGQCARLGHTRAPGCHRVTAVLTATSSTVQHSNTTRQTPHVHVAQSDQGPASQGCWFKSNSGCQTAGRTDSVVEFPRSAPRKPLGSQHDPLPVPPIRVHDQRCRVRSADDLQDTCLQRDDEQDGGAAYQSLSGMYSPFS